MKLIKWIMKYSVPLFSAYAVCATIFCILNWDSLPWVQRFALLFSIPLSLHEWEEAVWPGGFMELMAKKFQMELPADAPKGAEHIGGVWFLFTLSLLPSIFPQVSCFFTALLLAGIFEGILHVVGIKVHKLKKPYSPGMVTGLVMLALSITAIVIAGPSASLGILDWILGIVVFFIAYIIMYMMTFAALGLNPKEVMAGRKMGH